MGEAAEAAGLAIKGMQGNHQLGVVYEERSKIADSASQPQPLPAPHSQHSTSSRVVKGEVGSWCKQGFSLMAPWKPHTHMARGLPVFG